MLKTKFRLTECVWYYGTEYQEIAKTAITEDGKRHKIQTMEDGTEYFTIDNPYSDDECYDGFYGRIKDAVNAVKEHYADCIKGNALPLNIFQSGMFPIVFLDREKGEEAWKKSIEGWKNAKFGYCIKAGGKNSFGGYQTLDYHGDYTFKLDQNYTTEKEAKSKLNEWINTAKRFIKKYNKASSGDKKDKMAGDFIRSNSDFIVHIVFDMLENPNVTDMKKLPNFGYEIQQSLLSA